MSQTPTLDDAYWEARYRGHTDGWDLGGPSRPLKEFIERLTDKDRCVLIPGCGRGWEGQLMHDLGFTNVHLLDLTGEPYKDLLSNCPDFPREHLLIGDFFALEGTYDLILEQTFFCAIDPTLRSKYAEHMHQLLAPDGRLVGVLFDDPSPGKEPGSPPYGGSITEYRALFGKHFGQVSIEPCTNSIPPRAGREVWIELRK